MLFTSNGLSFEVVWHLCTNPDCHCNEDVDFSFHESDARGNLKVNGMALQAKVMVDGGMEARPPQRSELEASIVEAFLAHGRQGLFASIVEGQEEQRRIAEYRIGREDIENGTLVPYSLIVAGKNSVFKGGDRCSFVVTCQGRNYFGDDLYCPKPECRCEDVLMAFLGDSVDAQGKPITTNLFDVVLTLRGKVTVEHLYEPNRVNAALATSVIKALRAQDADLLQDLRERRRVIKEIAARSLNAAPRDGVVTAPRDVVQYDSAAKATRPESAAREGAAGGVATLVRKVGRNEACPCQSGKKYKRCCGA